SPPPRTRRGSAARCGASRPCAAAPPRHPGPQRAWRGSARRGGGGCWCPAERSFAPAFVDGLAAIVEDEPRGITTGPRDALRQVGIEPPFPLLRRDGWPRGRLLPNHLDECPHGLHGLLRQAR